MPGAGRLVHMPAHIYIRTGQSAKSAKSNADEAAVDEKCFKATGTDTGLYAAMCYGHNLQYGSAAAMATSIYSRLSGTWRTSSYVMTRAASST